MKDAQNKYACKHTESVKNMSNPYKEPYTNLLGDFAPIHPDVKFGTNVRLGEGVVIEEGCEIGDNTFIGHYSILRPKTKIGNDCKISHHCIFESPGIEIGNNVAIQGLSLIAEFTKIHDQVYVGPGTKIYAVRKIKHGRDFPLQQDGVIIHYGARIGGGCLILPGVIIGQEALIGAGSVVTQNCDPYKIYIGCPAKLHGDVSKDEYLNYGDFPLG